jgi:SAM-dependent methyltransferase
MHPEARQWVEANLPAGVRSVLELGSYDVNGNVRDLLPGVPYIGVDIRPGPGVDVVTDAASMYEIPCDPQLWKLQGTFDLVLCLEVLEHCEKAADIIGNAARALRPGGTLIVTTAGPGRPPHGVGGLVVGEEYYRNITREQLGLWLRHAGFTAIVLDEARDGQDVRCMGQFPASQTVAGWP